MKVSSIPMTFSKNRTLPNRVILIALSFLSLMLLAPPLSAQAPGTVRGIVVTEMGSPIAGATIRAGEKGPAVLSDAGGLFNLKVPPATYDILVSKNGFKTEKIPGVKVEPGKIKDVSALMRK